MFDKSKKQYIVKQLSGNVINIFHKDSAGICSCTLNRRNVWLDSVSIMKDALPGFVMCTAIPDSLHILCQDRHGNLVYLLHDNERWNSIPVLDSKNSSTYDKHLGIISAREAKYFFYVLEYSGSKLLSFQTYDDSGTVSPPKVIDYVIGDETPYSILKNAKDELYAFYRAQDGKHNQLGYKKYIPSRGHWSEFFPITKHSGECEILSTSIDYQNNFHICWQKQTLQKYELVYSSKNFISSNWDSERIVFSSSYPLSNVLLLNVDDKVIIYWVKDNNIFYCVSSDNGSTWSNPKKYAFYENKAFYCGSYLSNMPGEYNNTCFSELPISFTGGYKLGFINDYFPRSDNLTVEEVRTMLVDTIKQLSRNIDELKQSVKDVNAKLDNLCLRQNQLEMGVEKHRWEQHTTERTEPEAVIETELVEKVDECKKEDYEVEKISKPIMPGGGFSIVTPEYLRSLQKR